MPPVTWDKHRLTWMLNALYDNRQLIGARRALNLFKSRQNKVEILDSLVIFPNFSQVASSNKSLGDIGSRRKKNPTFAALNRCIPGASRQWIYMNLTPRSFGPN